MRNLLNDVVAHPTRFRLAASCQSPHFLKSELQIGKRRTFNTQTRVAPGTNPPPGVAHPRVSDAQSGNKSDGAVNGQHLAMISAKPAQRILQLWRIKAAHA